MDYRLKNYFLITGKDHSKGKKQQFKFPFCTFFLLGFTILSFILTAKMDARYLHMGAVMGVAIFEKGQFYRLLTSMFLHADFGHIFSNMLLLVCLGKIIEKEFGHVKVLLFYFISGLMGNLASAGYFFYSKQVVETIGASAGIYGLLGVAMVFCIANHGEFHNITYGKIVLFGMISLFEGIIITQNIDLIAHIVGFLVGMFLAGMFAYPAYHERLMREGLYEI